MRAGKLWLFGLVVATAPLAADDAVFRHDGQLGREGRTTLMVPVLEGQQLVFRLASLDAALRMRVSFGGVDYAAEAEGPAVVARVVHVRKSALAQVSIEGPAVPAGGNQPSFQFRVSRFRETVVLGRNAVVRGGIARGDLRDGRGAWIDWYPLPVAKGQRLAVGVSAREGAASVRVELPDGMVIDGGESIGLVAGVSFEAPETGTAWVGARLALGEDALREGASYPYAVYAREAPAPRQLLVSSAPSYQTYTIVAEDVPPLADEYDFTAPRAGVYRFRADGRDGAVPALRLRTDGGRVAADAAERGLRDWAQCRCYLRQGQSIRLSVGSLQPAARPGYGIMAAFDGPGQSLRDGDNLERALEDGRPAYFVYHGRAGEYAEFLMGSDDFETRLQVSDDAGQLFTWLKFYGSDFSYASRGGYWFDQAGDLVLEASGRVAQDAGSYRIQVRSSLSAGLDLPREFAARAPIALGGTAFARLTDRHAAVDGGRADEFVVELKALELTAIRLQSWDLPLWLEVVGPDGAVLTASDGPALKDATVEIIAPKAGRYALRVVAPCAEDQYLNITYSLQPESLGQLVPLEGEAPLRELDLAAAARGAGDALWVDIPLRLKAGRRVYLAAAAADFQPTVKLVDKDGIVVDENGSNGVRGQARIDYTVDKGGAYRLRVLRGPWLDPSAADPSARCLVGIHEVR